MSYRYSLLAVAALAACQARDTAPETASVRYLVAQGEYKLALSQAQAAYEADPGTEEDYKFASVAYLLARGREATFAGEDELALADFQQALDIDPTAVQAQQWVKKTSTKLSDIWFNLARDHHASDRLPEAAEAYDMALEYNTDNLDALEGLYRVGVQLEYRDGLALDYYNEGLSALREHELHVARSRFTYAGKYREHDVKPFKRTQEVNRQLAQKFTEHGLELEDTGFFAAARGEYRVATILDPENQAAIEGHERMAIEAQAHELLKSGEMWIRRKEFDQAVTVLKQGKDLSVFQKEKFDEVLAGIDDLRAEADYESALNLEHDFQYEEAVAAYGRLLNTYGFYEDARARASRLENVIYEVTELYGTIEGLSGDALLETLQRIDVLWPEYRDVQERLEALEE